MMSAKELQEFNKNRKITQVCYVTNDYKKTIEYLTNTLNWGPWTILKNNQISAHDVKSDGKPVEGDFEFLIAATFIGDIEFEIILESITSRNLFWTTTLWMPRLPNIPAAGPR